MKNAMLKETLYCLMMLLAAWITPLKTGAQDCQPPQTQQPLKSATDTPKNIPDLGRVESSIQISGFSGVIRDINVRTFLNHSRSSDLKVRLQAPSGKIITLTSGNGWNLPNVFNGTLWDDQADTASMWNEYLVSDHPYYQGGVTATPLAPEEPLGAFVKDSPNGTWKLIVDDLVPGSTFGVLSGWNIAITTVSGITTSLTAAFQNGDDYEISPAAFEYFSPIEVDGMGATVSRVRVKTNLEFVNVNFLTMSLVAPSGKEIVLVSRPGVFVNDVYNGTWWYDDAQVGNSVEDYNYQNGVAAPTLAPEEGFSSFIGENPNGTWGLRIRHHSDGNISGLLDGWTLELETCQGVAPSIGAALFIKDLQVQNTPAVGTGLVTVEAIIRNNGAETVALDAVQLPLASAFGSAWMQVAAKPTLAGGTAQTLPIIDTSYNGAANDQLTLTGTGVLAPGQTLIFRVQFRIDPDAENAVANPAIQLLVSGSGMQSGQMAFDYSDAGTDPQSENTSAYGHQSGADDPTRITVPVLKASMRLVSNCSNPVAAVSGRSDAYFELTVANLGNTTLDQLFLENKMSEWLGNAFVNTLPNFNQIIGGNAVQMPEMNPDFDGDTENRVWKGQNGRLAPRQTITIQLHAALDAFALAPTAALFNQADLRARVTGLNNVAVPKLDGSAGPWLVVDATDAGTSPASLNGNTGENDPTPVPAIALSAPVNGVVEAGDTLAMQQWLQNGAATAFNLTGCSELSRTYTLGAFTPGACGATGVYDVQFTVSSACNACVTYQAQLSVEDHTAPTLLLSPPQITLDCSHPNLEAAIAEWAAAAPQASDPSGVQISHSALQAGAPGQAVTVTFTATDGCGHQSTVEGVIQTFDFQAPVFVTVPADTTIVCPAEPVFVTPVVNDACSPFALSYQDTYSGGNCSTGYVVVRTWMAMDASGNFATAVATITVLPESGNPEPPTFTFTPAGDTIAYGDPVVFGTPGVSSTCTAGPLTLTFVDQVTGDDCSGTVHIRTWTATDACGAVATAAQTIVVLPDTEAPVFGAFPTLVTIPQTEWETWVAGMSALVSDNSGTVTVDVETVPVDTCEVKAVFTAVDACGHSSTAEVTVLWNDGPCAPSNTQDAGAAIAGITIFPNPAQDWIRLQWAVSEPVWVEVYDAGGRLAHSAALSSGQDALSVAHLPAGQWFLRVVGERQVFTAPFILQR